MVTVDSPWNPEQRSLAIGLSEYEDQLCPHCHYPLHLCRGDDFLGVNITEYTCRTERRVAAHRRELRKKHKDDDGWDDGLHIVGIPVTKEDQRAK